MSQRIKGQEVEIVVLVNGQPSDNLTFARNIEFTYKTEILQEGYLGETTDRYDAVFKGISGNLEFHFNDAAPFALISELVNKARRRLAGTRINIKTTMNFPSGRRVRVIIRDAEFGELPINFGSRSDYGTFKLTFGASDAQTLPA